MTTIAAATQTRSSRRWLALSVLALAQFLVILDASIVNIALPVLGDHLGLDTVALAWVITAYVLPFGALLLFGGRLADRFGHRRLFLVGTAGFLLASAFAGLSTSGGMLLSARALQGMSAALLAPAALALLTQLFPDTRDRARALGVWGGVAGIGSVAGVLLGGVLTATLGWQAVFFVNVPVAAIVLGTVPLLITRDRPAAAAKLDLPGAVTVTAALTALVGALSAAEQTGPLSPLTLSLGAGTIALGALFALIERRTAEPLLPLSIFGNRALRTGNIVVLLVGGSIVALFFALSVYLQAVLGYDAFTAGISQLPLAGILVIAAATAPMLIARRGARPTLVFALVVLAAGLLWLAAAPSGAVFAVHLLGPTLLIGLGVGAALVTATQLSVDGVPEHESGLAGGLVNTSQQIGGALGLALLASIAAARTASLDAAGAPVPEALTGGFSWLFAGAAVLVLAAAVVTVAIRPSRSRWSAPIHLDIPQTGIAMSSSPAVVTEATTRRVRIPVYLQIAAWAVPVLVLVQFSLVAVLPLAVLVIGSFVDRRARSLRVWSSALAVVFVTPLLIWMLRSDPAQSLSKDMHPVLSALIALVGSAVLVHVYRRGRRA